MGRTRRRHASRPAELPAPLPPETRTVGQLVAESVRLYGGSFWRALPLGVSVAFIDQALFGVSRAAWVVLMMTLGAALLTTSYASAASLVAGVRLNARTYATALAAGVLVFLPFPVLMLVFVLPGIAWLAFAGLAVPVAVIERTGLRASLARGVALARADYVHALGSLATLALVYFLTRLVLVFLLRGTGEQTERIAVFLADVVISPILFLGAALLYFDQAARLVGSAAPTRPRRRGDADLHSPDEPDSAGRPDPEVEPRAAP
jgi:hypothetical protein